MKISDHTNIESLQSTFNTINNQLKNLGFSRTYLRQQKYSIIILKDCIIV